MLLSSVIFAEDMDAIGTASTNPMIASFMRSDPDIILMGEVRDLESAELAIEAAITGHKVLTTIHTPRASQIIERWKIAQTLKAACAQRLVRILCPYCKEPSPGINDFDRRTFSLDDSWAAVPLFSSVVQGMRIGAYRRLERDRRLRLYARGKEYPEGKSYDWNNSNDW